MPANIIPTALTDGIAYATDVPLTPTEATLGDGLKTPTLIEIAAGQVIVAVVKLTINGFVTGNNTFVFLQTDMGDGVWVDMAWIFFNRVQVETTFVLCGGSLAANSAFQVLRNPSSAPDPQANGANDVPIGGRVRFSGFSKMTGGSSSAPGVSTSVNATIKYKIRSAR